MIQFLNPILLAGLAAIVVPIVLHLLSRARFRSVDWGAMMFLPGGDSRRPQASRLRQWALLGMRSALIAILAITLALPVVRAGRPPGPMLAVIILDHSASMGRTENDRSRLDRAREAAVNVLAHLYPGDQAALITVGGEDSTTPATDDLQSIAQKILATEQGNEHTDFAAALMRAAILCRQHQDERARIFIVSDRQANNWLGIDPAFAKKWNNQKLPPITWLPIGSGSTENVAIDSVDLFNAPAIAELSTEIELHVHNYGNVSRGPIHLMLSSGDQQLVETDLTLEPRENRAVKLPIHFAHAGAMELTAAIDTVDLLSDNSRQVALDVVERLPVLIISGDQRLGRFRSESDFLRLALSPFSSPTTRPADDPRNPCVVTVIGSDSWTPRSLNGHRVVVLANVPNLSTDQVRALEQFTYTGGGVIIAPGNLVRPDDYNQMLYRNATGILPAMLQTPTSADAAPTALLGIDLSHPIFQFLKGSPDPIPQATIARYFPANPHGGDVRVLASYVTGEPFVVEGAFGHGHVLLVTTPLDADWSNLPLSNFYLPFVQSCVKYLCAASMSKRNLLPGQMISGNLDGDVEQRTVHVALPDGHSDACELSPLGDRVQFRFGPVNEPGEYQVRATTPRGEIEQRFIVAPPAEESDLTSLSPNQSRQLRESLKMTVQVSAAKTSQASTGDFSLWLFGIVLVIAVGISESLLAGAWGWGRGRQR